MLTTRDVQAYLAALGYYDGDFDGDYQDANYRDDLRRFQRDYGLTADGWYGARTEAVLKPLADKLRHRPDGLGSCRRWQLTTYWVGDAKAWSGAFVPMKNPRGELIASVPAPAFAEAALEGVTRLLDGRLAGVAHPAYSPCDPAVFKPVYEIAQRNGWLPEKPGYAGIQLSGDGSRAASSRNFDIRKSGPKGWPVEAKGIECDPFRTIAADNGALPKHDPAFKGKGGVVPAGTRVWILELVGMRLPDATTHDGWCTVNDTGGGIYGAHFDVFTGTRSNAKNARIPARAHIWFEGIEGRLPMNYSYGL
jgi:hypothetical protein